MNNDSLLVCSTVSILFLSLINPGQYYDLNNTTALPTLLIQVFHKSSATLVGSDQPMGEVEIPLSSIKGDGSSLTERYPLKKFGRMKDVTGEVPFPCLHLLTPLFRSTSPSDSVVPLLARWVSMEPSHLSS
jgi:hypothetical protein